MNANERDALDLAPPPPRQKDPYHALRSFHQNRAVEPLLDLCDMVGVMTVNPGFGGQSFIRSGVDKTRAIRAMIADRPGHIQIDGGVTPETAPLVAAAGVEILVAGSAVYRGGSVANPGPYGANIRAIRAAAEKATVAWA